MRCRRKKGFDGNMTNRLSLWISRHLRLGASSGSRVGTVIAIAGVALATAVMELTLGVVVGFKTEIVRKLVGFEAQVTISAPYDPFTRSQATSLALTPELEQVISDAMPSAECRLVLHLPGIIKTDNDFEALVFYGRSQSDDNAFEKGNIVEGVWPDYSQDSCRNQIVISRATAQALGISLGDKVYSTFIIDGSVKMRRNTVAGIYAADFGEYDRGVAYGSIGALQSIAGLDSVSGAGIEIRNLDQDSVALLGSELEQRLIAAVAEGRLDSYYPVQTIEQTGAIYFNWLSLLDTNVAVIFALMLCVGAFTLVSSLFILVLNNVAAIGILRSMGATRGLVRRVFVNLGLRLILPGMVAGNVLAFTILLVQKYTRVIPLDPEAYYLNAVPVSIDIWAFVALNAGIALFSWMVLWIPARTAAKIDPAKTINFE